MKKKMKYQVADNFYKAKYTIDGKDNYFSGYNFEKELIPEEDSNIRKYNL